MNTDRYNLTAEEHEELFTRLRASEAAITEACAMASTVLALARDREYLIEQLAYYMPYRRLYHDAMNASIAHNQEIIGGMVKLVADGRINFNKAPT